jgi:hypothetical protein
MFRWSQISSHLCDRLNLTINNIYNIIKVVASCNNVVAYYVISKSAHNTHEAYRLLSLQAGHRSDPINLYYEEAASKNIEVISLMSKCLYKQYEADILCYLSGPQFYKLKHANF